MASRIALLRGVNLGPSRRVAMADIRNAMANRGFTKVRSLLQSGNLLFDADGGGETLESALEQTLLIDLDLTTDVMVRTAAEWRSLIAANPFVEAAARDPGRLVAFVLKRAPGAGAEAAVNAIDGPERTRVIGSVAYIHYPDGQAATKVAGARLDKALGVRGTGRNWNTVLKIADLADA